MVDRRVDTGDPSTIDAPGRDFRWSVDLLFARNRSFGGCCGRNSVAVARPLPVTGSSSIVVARDAVVNDGSGAVSASSWAGFPGV
jgi:hypothetical protein